MLPTDAKERKAIPIYSGFICYFPLAIVEMAKLSYEGNEQHNPGTPLRWDRSKSGDEMDAMMRHTVDGAAKVQTLDDAVKHQRAVAWRANAQLQKLCEMRDENSKSQKFPTRTGCTGNPPCLTDAGSRQQIARELKDEYDDYIERLQSCGEEDCK